jgi:spore germination protein GerM
VATLAACVLLAGSGCRREPAVEAPREVAPAPTETTAMPVTLYFPGPGGLLGVERREVAGAGRPEERMARVIEALLAGPQTAGLAAPFAAGVEVEALYLNAEGTAYVDLKAPESQLPLSAGSTQERQIVMSLVNSIALNVPEARRVVLLWNGVQPGTLAGHLDLTRPLAPDEGLVAR